MTLANLFTSCEYVNIWETQLLCSGHFFVARFRLALACSRQIDMRGKTCRVFFQFQKFEAQPTAQLRVCPYIFVMFCLKNEDWLLCIFFLHMRQRLPKLQLRESQQNSNDENANETSPIEFRAHHSRLHAKVRQFAC